MNKQVPITEVEWLVMAWLHRHGECYAPSLIHAALKPRKGAPISNQGAGRAVGSILARMQRKGLVVRCFTKTGHYWRLTVHGVSRYEKGQQQG